MAEVVYALCALASLLCAGLLARSWRESRNALLFWCLLCFVGLALNNLLLFVDEVVLGDAGLDAWRTLPAALGVGALVFGLIWETRE